jgi:hypothetical protein
MGFELVLHRPIETTRITGQMAPGTPTSGQPVNQALKQNFRCRLSSMKLFISVALGAIAAALIGALLIIALWAHDVWDDRKHTARTESETPVYVGSGDEACEGKPLTVLQAGLTLRVRRIRYWKDCATVDIALPNGQEGHIVLGRGDVSISPSLAPD